MAEQPVEADKRCLKLSISCDPQLVETISDYLVGVVEAGVETGAKDEPLYGTVNGYLVLAAGELQREQQLLADLRGYLVEVAEIFTTKTPKLTVSEVEQQDWGKSWKEFFKPFAIVPGLVIVPTWEQYQPAPGEEVIIMDPGMAFGTGHHATTALSLELIRRVVGSAGAEQTILDVGTGTGILGMAAARFGARHVLGIDNDPEAVRVAAENVSLNQLQHLMSTAVDPLAEVAGSFSLVVANIVHDVLLELAGDLVGRIAAGGRLILSGILVGQQSASIVAAFTAHGLSLVEEISQGEWAAILLVKK